ncbi:YibE/F family protein [Nocardioides lianchengensis]|uniref:YibE/F-like protein n=1 Tax=Nocardioides lianchengensis TaxID=1045774 RepID=A0A1G6LFJ4_9ACTN|nr:YibE/F family protein [Nocardioides lianchengensis]NYG12591.1 putative membrane protein [Nocardioides lianchengensis]SDC41356.1 YibE/F-like protein [Nocardioides lianchengensis]
MAGAHSHRRERRRDDHAGHSHTHDAPDLRIGRGPRTVLLAFLALVAVVTAVGVWQLWPDGGKVDELTSSVPFAAPGVEFPTAEVVRTEADQLVVSYDGEEVGLQVPPQVLDSDLGAGDTVRLVVTPGAAGEPDRVSWFGVDRTRPIWIMVGLFALVVVAVARLRGVLALVGLGFAGLVLLQFVLPALLVGEPAIAVGLVGSAAIMYVVLFTTHGFSIRTSAALAGTHVGVALTAVVGWLAVRATSLSGIGDDGSTVLSGFAPDLDFSGLMTCAVIIAGLGVLNDVTITQASAVWELRGAAPGMSRSRLFASGMRIGRDHIASTIYTIVFAYAGTALTVLLVLELYGLPVVDLLATEEIAQEVVRTLATSIGLVLAVPVTTAIAVATVPAPSTNSDKDALAF